MLTTTKRTRKQRDLNTCWASDVTNYDLYSEDQLAIDEVEEIAANDNFLLRFEKNMTKAEIEASTSKKGMLEIIWFCYNLLTTLF